jgi:hypothetical protein
VQGDFFFQHGIGQRFVAEDEAVAIAGKRKGHAQKAGVFDGLGHASAHAVVVVFGFDRRNRDVGLEEQCVVGFEDSALVAMCSAAAHADAPGAQAKLMKNLRHRVPTRLLNGGRDVAGADVAFGELFLVQSWARGEAGQIGLFLTTLWDFLTQAR